MKTEFIGISQATDKIRDIVQRVSQDTALNVLITGETGCGKEVVAQLLYDSSPRSSKKFVKINCAAIPDTLLESELFGVEQGAYTGAHKKRKGKFELADGGVLFLDEIGDMSFHLQAKLLHVLQGGEYSRLGSEHNLTSNTWVISATNNNLQLKINEKAFREDLYYRLNMVHIHIPPLRHRPEDIPVLIDYYTLALQKRHANRHIAPLDAQTHKRLCGYSWPGNVRQLISVLHRILLIGCDNATLDEILPTYMCEQHVAPEAERQIYGDIMNEIRNLSTKTPDQISCFSLKKIKKEATNIVEKEAISQILNMTNWNRTHASKILQISYKTLLTKIDQLEIIGPE